MMKKEQFLSYINSGVQEDVLCAYFLCSKQAKNTIYIYINLYLYVPSYAGRRKYWVLVIAMVMGT